VPYGSYFGAVAFPVITSNITIDGKTPSGNYANGFTIQRNSTNQFRFFAVNAKTSGNPNAKLVLRNIILQSGDSGANGGGAVFNDGTLVLSRCTFKNNRGGTRGGVIYNGDQRNMRVNSRIFIGNQATGTQSLGGAIYNSSSATFSIKTSTFKSNRATSKGNAIYLYNNLSNTTKVNYTAFIDNATVGVPSIHNEGPYILNGQCNYWSSSVSDLHMGVDSSNERPAARPLGLDEMLYPVFGEERVDFDDDELN
jgi:hypothetical protein